MISNINHNLQADLENIVFAAKNYSQNIGYEH